MESATRYNQILPVSLYLNSKQKKQLMLSFGYSYHFYVGLRWSQLNQFYYDFWNFESVLSDE